MEKDLHKNVAPEENVSPIFRVFWLGECGGEKSGGGGQVHFHCCGEAYL